MAGKANVGARASQFLSQIGTAGGPVGAMTAPNLVAYGAGNLQAQVVAGNTDEYARQRGAGSTAVVGTPHSQSVPMAANCVALSAKICEEVICAACAVVSAKS